MQEARSTNSTYTAAMTRPSCPSCVRWALMSITGPATSGAHHMLTNRDCVSAYAVHHSSVQACEVSPCYVAAACLTSVLLPYSNLIFELWERPSQTAGAAPRYLVRVLYNREVLHFPGTDEGATVHFFTAHAVFDHANLRCCSSTRWKFWTLSAFSSQMAPSSCRRCLGATHWTQHSTRTCASSSWSTTAPCQVRKAAMQCRGCDTACLPP